MTIFGTLNIGDGTPWLDVKAYGATGDGATDDTTAIQAAVNAIPAAGGVVFVPPGVYLISGPINLNAFVIVRGVGYQGTEIRAKSTFSGAAMIQNLTQDGTQQFVGIESLYVNANKSVATVPIGIKLSTIGQPTYLRDVAVGSATGNGIVVDGGSVGGAAGFLLDNVWVSSCNDHNIVLQGELYDAVLQNVTSEFQAAGKAAIHLNGTASGIGRRAIRLHNIHTEFSGASSYGVLIESFINVLVDTLLYVGSTGTGDLVRINGLAADTNQIILRNLMTSGGAALANMVNDTTRSVTITTSLTTFVREYTTGGAIYGATEVINGNLQISNNVGLLVRSADATSINGIGVNSSDELVVGSGNKIVRINISTGGASGANMLVLENGMVKVAGRLQPAKGANIAAANNLTLGADGTLFHITGATQINAITTTNWQAGSEITLIFDSTPTVKHNTAGGAGTAVLLLAGAVDFVATANDTLTLVYDGTSWFEKARSVI